MMKKTSHTYEGMCHICGLQQATSNMSLSFKVDLMSLHLKKNHILYNTTIQERCIRYSNQYYICEQNLHLFLGKI